MTTEEYQRAEERAKSLRGFYTNLVAYFVVNFTLIVINLVTSPGELWFYWVTIFWGIALVFHAVDVFTLRGKYLGKEWEEKKTRDIMEKEEKRKKDDENRRQAG